MKILLENWRKFLKEEDTKPKHVLILGDSQIKGSVGIALEKYLKTLGYRVTRTGEVSAGALRFKRLARRFKGQKFDHVIASSGGNDAWMRIPSKKWQKHINKHYIPLFKQLKQLSPNVHWFGPAPNLSIKKETNPKRINFSKALQGLANEHGIRYTPMTDLWKNLESKKVPIKVGARGAFRDSLHYHKAGADAYAEKILKDWQQSQETNAPGPALPPLPDPQELDIEPTPDISKNPTMRLEPMQEESKE